jgi:hypothetical protein
LLPWAHKNHSIVRIQGCLDPFQSRSDMIHNTSSSSKVEDFFMGSIARIKNMGEIGSPCTKGTNKVDEHMFIAEEHNLCSYISRRTKKYNRRTYPKEHKSAWTSEPRNISYVLLSCDTKEHKSLLSSGNIRFFLKNYLFKSRWTHSIIIRIHCTPYKQIRITQGVQ